MSGRGTGPGAKDPPLHEQVAPRVAELHAAGHGRNEVARRLDVSPTTVTRAADHAGVKFDNASTDAATRGRTAQLEDRRADLAVTAADLADMAGRRLKVELEAELADPVMLTAVNRVWGTSVDKLTGLSATLTDHRDEHAAARLWIEGIGMQITAAAEGLTEPDASGHYRISFPAPTPTSTEES